MQAKLFSAMICLLPVCLLAQKLEPGKLADTGQSTGYTNLPGEDADFIIHPLSYMDNGDGTITDHNSGLIWQKTDGGEKSFENALLYCAGLTLAGYTDWRLPTCHELFTINSYDRVNPALNTDYFSKTEAEYWWTSDRQLDDAAKVWLVNAGGGIGAHPKTETISSGGTKKVHVRAVRNPFSTSIPTSRFQDNLDGTITDHHSGLIWQQIPSTSLMTWEDALRHAANLSLAGSTDWRLPNIKELQSLNDEKLANPSFNNYYFAAIVTGHYWSSTTLVQSPAKAWDISTAYGIVSYQDKTAKENVLCVRGGCDNNDLHIVEIQIPSGEFIMGDHFGFVDPNHPSDELPLHTVKINAFSMARTETTNEQFMTFLNSRLLQGLVTVRDHAVYNSDSNVLIYYLYQTASYYSISYDGKIFSMADFRANHPVVGVMWAGAASFCNWLSLQNGLSPCYDEKTWTCDFSRNGYRLPTEAEWEYAGRGGQTNPYFNYPWGNDQEITKANWPDSKDPYEGTNTTAYPYTTPVGFYDGTRHLKTEYNWPGKTDSYQTASGANGFGLYDMAGNVWEFVNDWYGQNYYFSSLYDNPTGPETGFIMPDGQAYRGMRGGNWYNGYTTFSVNDGHSRVSNRNPSYYRGPQDPNHPWYHVGFRVARRLASSPTSVSDASVSTPWHCALDQNYPNPFNPNTTIRFVIPATEQVSLKIFDALGREISTLVNQELVSGSYEFTFSGQSLPSGVFFYQLRTEQGCWIKKMLLVK